MSRFYIASQRSKGLLPAKEHRDRQPLVPGPTQTVQEDLSEEEWARNERFKAATELVGDTAGNNESSISRVLDEIVGKPMIVKSVRRPDPVPDPPGDATALADPAYERITQKLLAFRKTQLHSVILVASSVPGEGTSTIAKNIAHSLAQGNGDRVALIDANLRSPRQHLHFSEELEVGLTDVLTGAASLDEALRTNSARRITLLTAGNRAGKPSHVLSPSSVERIIASLLSTHHWVIVDSPSVTSCPDASSLAEVCGGAILVLHAEQTRREVADEAKRILEESGVEIIGAVLNRRKYHIPEWIYRRL